MADIKQVQAIARGVQMTPRKIGLVASLVRGRTVADALTILEHTPKRAAQPVAKAIASARANAKTTHKLDEKTLIVEQLQITSGPSLRRYRPAARGRALPYRKRTSHIHVLVSGLVKEKKVAPKPAAKASTKKESK